MDKLIAYCGLDCSKCEAYIATINNDDVLRETVPKKWSELNNVEITKEMINCMGCKSDGVKTVFCIFLCPIRKCAIEKKIETCGDCDKLEICKEIKMIIDTNIDASNRLKNK